MSRLTDSARKAQSEWVEDLREYVEAQGGYVEGTDVQHSTTMSVTLRCTVPLTALDGDADE